MLVMGGSSSIQQLEEGGGEREHHGDQHEKAHGAAGVEGEGGVTS